MTKNKLGVQMSVIDSTTLSLFNSFPREVSKTYDMRSVVNSLPEFERYLEINNGVTNCFTSVWSFNNVIDKVPFDFDYGKSILVVKKGYKVWTELGINTVPVITGKKGFHSYIRVKPYYEPNAQKRKSLLRKASYFFLKLVFNKVPNEIDTSVIGDVRQLIRIPGTLRPPKNERWCTYLPPDFHTMNNEDINRLANRFKTYVYESGNILDLKDLPKISMVEVDRYFGNTINGKQHQNNTVLLDEGPIVASKEVQDFLRPIIRPCLFTHIIRANPTNLNRVYAAQDLLESFSVEQVVRMFSKIGWYDYREEVTRTKVRFCKKYRGASCRRLIEKGIPNRCCEG